MSKDFKKDWSNDFVSVEAKILGLEDVWQVLGARIDMDEKVVRIGVQPKKGSSFACTCCGQMVGKVHDYRVHAWRHLDWHQYRTELVVRVPRVRCPDCGVKQVCTPWARENHRITYAFEQHVMGLVKDMPVNAAARHVKEHDTRLWRVIHHWVDDARANADHSQVTRVAFDETATKRGHNYISIFVDLSCRKVVFATPGKDAETVGEFANDRREHGGDPERVTDACMDMSKAFVAGTRQYLPAAQITFDKFHIVKLVSEAVDEVRRTEQKTMPELKGTRFAWLKNPKNCTAKQKETLESLSKTYCDTARAYRMRLTFQDLFSFATRAEAEPYFNRWVRWASRSRIPAMVKVAKTVREHKDGILRWHDSRIANGILEGINSLVQAAKSKARGYRSLHNLEAMIYLIAGGFNFPFPT